MNHKIILDIEDILSKYNLNLKCMCNKYIEFIRKTLQKNRRNKMNCKPQIYVINGSGGVGKDTFVDYIGKFLDIKKISSVETIKKFLFDHYKLSRNDKTEVYRKIVSDIKDVLSKYDLSFKWLCEVIDENLYSCVDFDAIFVIVREPAEISRIVERYNAKTILIVNNEVDGIYSNHADANVTKYNYDYVVDNSYSMDALNQECHDFMKLILKQKYINELENRIDDMKGDQND